MKKLHLPSQILIAVLVLSGCFFQSADNGGTETGDATISGVLYNPGGTPAANASVRILSVSHDPRMGLLKGQAGAGDTVSTDGKGRFKSKRLAEGKYNVLASGGNNAFYEDSVEVTSKAPSSTGTDTLRPTGTIRGVIRLQSNHSSRSVLILAFGTNTFTAPLDSVGNFTINNMAAGTYHVRFLSTLDDYGQLDTALSFVSGVESVLADTLRLPFRGIPVVTGLELDYDTLLQIVTLTWDRADTALVAGYNVYRRNSGLDGGSVKINGGPVRDTVYWDSTGIQDSTYEYQVVAVDARGNEGGRGSIKSIAIVKAFNIIKFLNVSTLSVELVTVVGGLNNKEMFILSKSPVPAVYKIDSNGNEMAKALLSNDSGNGDFVPQNMAIDKDQNIYISSADKYIAKYSPVLSFMKTWETQNPITKIFLQDSVLLVGTTGGVEIFKLDGMPIDSIKLDQYVKGIAGTRDSIIWVLGSKTLLEINPYSRTQRSIISTDLSNLSSYDDNGDLKVYGQENLVYLLNNKIYLRKESGNLVLKFDAPISTSLSIDALGETLWLSQADGKILIYKK